MNQKFKNTLNEISKTPCKCGSNRWKTIEKNKKYKCRTCGMTRVIEQD